MLKWAPACHAAVRSVHCVDVSSCVCSVVCPGDGERSRKTASTVCWRGAVVRLWLAVALAERQMYYAVWIR